MAARRSYRPQPRILRLAYHLGLGPLVIAGRSRRVAAARPGRRPADRSRVAA